MLSTDIAALFCRECVHNMPGWDFGFWLILAMGGTLLCLSRCHRKFKRARLIEDMPTSRIRSASQGYTELIGVAELQGNPQLAPLSNTLCLWWRYTIEKYQSSGKSSHWVTVENRTCSQPFYLKDTTGICRVEHQGADISCHHRHTWYGNTRRPIGVPKSSDKTTHRRSGFLSLATTRISFGRSYRYTEHLIMEGDPLYTLGHFETDSGGLRTLTPKQLIGNVLNEWKQDFSELLARFDKNGDGELDLKEWQIVRDAALKDARRRQIKQSQQPAEHVLTQPQHKGLPFIIGSQEQQQLSKRFRRSAIFYSLGFFLAGSLATWLASSRLGF
ncbi:MAG: hypothetical protein KBT53_00890 [Porticoccus sp.]|nr:hypothetical protein [Porticoccus sp.]MBQ0807603.1 hypothetical protein [Porticoccus sp.]